MPSEMMHPWMFLPPYEPLERYKQPPLECDITLVEDALNTIIHSVDQNSVTAETLQLKDTLAHYLNECNNAFLANEKIRLLLLLSLFASLSISFIAVAIMPVSAVSISLIGLLTLILFATHFFTMLHQLSNYQQENDWNKLTKLCTHPLGKFFFETVQKNNEFNSKLIPKKVSSPTNASCLYSLQKNSQNDAVNTPTEIELLNKLNSPLNRIDEDSVESNDSSASFSH